MELSDLKGIGPVRSEALRAMGISSLRDLLFTLPIRYEDHHTVSPCSTTVPGNYLMSGIFETDPSSSYFHGLSRITASLRDESGKVSVCWYNEPWIAQKIKKGKEARLFGRLTVVNHRRILQNPRFVPDDGLQPVYRTVKGFPAKSFRDLIRLSLEQIDDCCPETLPREIRITHSLCELNYALRQAHYPDSLTALLSARRRLAFERSLIYLIYILSRKNRTVAALPFDVSSKDSEQFWLSLPFVPTKAQRRTLSEISDDLRKSQAMHRLVQGDVGSGKTAVAFGAIYLTWRAGHQASMMAPTEILAQQHYENAKKVLEPFGLKCRLLTGSTKASERKCILAELKNGKIDALFGTHALISEDVIYHDLQLVITDEQHRFGVNQRSDMENKGIDSGNHPHVLVMSATPIPRSLALILYGDLDISVIDELPAGRIPVKTRIVPESKRNDMYRFVKEQVQEGKQAYIVCPLVEETEEKEDSELKSAKSLFNQLKEKELAGLHIGLTWGKQKQQEKNEVLESFLSGDIQVLVSTTVIEVGVNNPNATIMIIENAERFGLSQLHQLRGRVGRGKEESWCFLLADATERLRILCNTSDGFKVAQTDLEQRGPGDLMGTRQSGIPIFSWIDGDIKLLHEVSECVRDIRKDPEKNGIAALLENEAESWFGEDDHHIAMN